MIDEIIHEMIMMQLLPGQNSSMLKNNSKQVRLKVDTDNSESDYKIKKIGKA
jgi:hypothetical protein